MLLLYDGESRQKLVIHDLETKSYDVAFSAESIGYTTASSINCLFAALQAINYGPETCVTRIGCYVSS